MTVITSTSVPTFTRSTACDTFILDKAGGDCEFMVEVSEDMTFVGFEGRGHLFFFHASNRIINLRLKPHSALLNNSLIKTSILSKISSSTPASVKSVTLSMK